jgi:hypothetical protein
MLLMLSGEGSGDIGICRADVGMCEGTDFRPGPMAWLIDKLVEPLWRSSPIDTGSFVFVREDSLVQYTKEQIRPLSFPGKGRPLETRFHFKNARALGRMAKERAVTVGCPVGAVLFRDSDGTRSTPANEWNAKVVSMEDGFAAEGFDFGVAMVPRPKSEAWLLCALKDQPYQNCAPLEDASGNDASPNNLKKQVDEVLDADGKTTGDLPGMVNDRTIDAQRIDMPSYNRFRARMQDVATRMLRNG